MLQLEARGVFKPINSNSENVRIFSRANQFKSLALTIVII